jgi:hypothetical protein
MGSENNNLQATQGQTRLLLALWDLAGTEDKVAKGKLNERSCLHLSQNTMQNCNY